jgi:sensor histidine kinase YesM
MDNAQVINTWKISRGILFRHYPPWFFISLLFALLGHSQGAPFIKSLIIYMILMPLIHLFTVIPIVIFRPVKSFNRLMVMVISSLIFVVLYTIALNLMFSPDPSLSLIRILILNIHVCQLFFVIGCCFCIYFYNEEKQYIAEKRSIAERIKRINNEKMITETHLKLLQAQIEPHFLFNTLTSILSLSKNDPQKAKKMLNNFMQYLETTLTKTRANVTTIGQDIELLKAYLEIFKVRMGKRLRYSVKADKNLMDLPFPSMLIQPIVENAVKHGLEPKIDGGEINIKVKMIEGDRIRWDIVDTGLGMSDKANKGTGLSNVMERVKSLYGHEGHLTLMDNKPSGVIVTLEVPCV